MPHLFAPDSWRLPVKLGLTAEFSFQRTAFDDSPATLELRPIIEKTFGLAQFDLNPAVERSIARAPRTHEWSFEPSFRFAYEVNQRLSPTFEYYGVAGPLGNFLPTDREIHQIYPGISASFANDVQWDLGIGVGLTPAGNRLVYKTRIQFAFGRRAK